MTRPTLLSTAALLLTACAAHDEGLAEHTDDHAAPDDEAVPPADLPTESDGPFDVALAPDLDPDASVVEVSLEAKVADVEISPGRLVSMWTYNGQLPGPSIEARAGDTVRVHFKNSLPEETTIHWHGIRVPAMMDGVSAAMAPIAAGEEFTYEFVVPDAGTFWYHPHVRSDEQVERGLYGAFVVRDDAEPETTTDRTVVLDDVLVGDDWQLLPFDPMDAMVGRQGNVILVNGRVNPVAELEHGGLHRFRFINTANARYFRLSLPGHQLIQIGSDGGLLTEPEPVDELLLVPGERADVLVVADGEEQATDWMSLRYDRGHGTGDLPEVSLFRVEHKEGANHASPAVPSTLRTIEALPEATVKRELRLEESVGMMMTGEHSAHAGHGVMGMPPVFSINGEVFPDVAPLAATLGTVEEWSIVNTTEMDHPFHLHGFRFQVTAVDGIEPDFIAWRDSINIPAEMTVEFRVRLEDNPGTWMFHCHILEHAERGMMGELAVVDE